MSIFTRIIKWARTACTVLHALRSLAAAMYRLIITVIPVATAAAAAALWSEVMPPLA